MLATAPVALLEAPGGFGKSTAVQGYCRTLDLPTIRVVLRSAQGTAGLLASLAVAASRVGLSPIAEAVDAESPDGSMENVLHRLASADPVAVAIDEVQRLDLEGARWLADFARELPEGHHLLIAGRRLPAQIRQLAESGSAVLVTTNDLRFDEDEARTVVEGWRGTAIDDGELRSIMAATEGWPAAVVVAAGAGQPAVAISAGRPETALRELIDRLVAEAQPGTAEVFGRLSRLPLLSTEVAEIVAGVGTFEQLLEAGFPIRFRPDGSQRTFAEMGQAEENRYSMRRQALERLRERLGSGSSGDGSLG